MVTEVTQEGAASAFAQQTPLLIKRIDSTMTEFSRENDGINPLAVITALTYILCHAALGTGLSRNSLVLGLASTYDHLSGEQDSEGAPLQ